MQINPIYSTNQYSLSVKGLNNKEKQAQGNKDLKEFNNALSQIQPMLNGEEVNISVLENFINVYDRFDMEKTLKNSTDPRTNMEFMNQLTSFFSSLMKIVTPEEYFTMQADDRLMDEFKNDKPQEESFLLKIRNKFRQKTGRPLIHTTLREYRADITQLLVDLNQKRQTPPEVYKKFNYILKDKHFTELMNKNQDTSENSECNRLEYIINRLSYDLQKFTKEKINNLLQENSGTKTPSLANYQYLNMNKLTDK